MKANHVYTFIGLLLPLILLASTWTLFSLLQKHYEPKTAYLIGFLFYWLVWCLVIPFLFLKPAEIRSLFAVNDVLFQRSKFVNVSCLIIPLVLGYGFAFPRASQ